MKSPTIQNSSAQSAIRSLAKYFLPGLTVKSMGVPLTEFLKKTDWEVLSF